MSDVRDLFLSSAGITGNGNGNNQAINSFWTVFDEVKKKSFHFSHLRRITRNCRFITLNEVNKLLYLPVSLLTVLGCCTEVTMFLLLPGSQYQRYRKEVETLI